jgi:hypothetical protein
MHSRLFVGFACRQNPRWLAGGTWTWIVYRSMGWLGGLAENWTWIPDAYSAGRIEVLVDLSFAA